MANERYTEDLVLKQMDIELGSNASCYCLPQGDCSSYPNIAVLLEEAGGRPKSCTIDDYETKGPGKAKPEFIITLKNDVSTVFVIECKNSMKKHSSENLSKPRDFAVDGVLYYAKHLKKDFDVIAIAVSGTSAKKFVSDAFYWQKGAEKYSLLPRSKNVIYSPEQYLHIIKGEHIARKYSPEEVRQTAIDMNNALREVKVTEKLKPIFIAGILIALSDESFEKEYASCTTVKSLINRLNQAIDDVLDNSDIKPEKIESIKFAFKALGRNPKLKEIPLGQYNSITWYIEQLANKIKPMMDSADETLDSLGLFYHEFIKYTGGDGKGLGIVLTPQHLTEFMCDIANVSKNDRVVDICCGSASFLVTAMSKMWQQATAKEDIERIKREGLYGVELDEDIYTLAIANMIVRKDGKSNIFNDDCFREEVYEELRSKHLTVGLINPPYSQDDYCELEFVERMLSILQPGGTGVAVVPTSCAIGTKFKAERKRLMENHTLKAVFSMPDDIFYPTGTIVCVMVWEAHRRHDPHTETFFGYYKDDGFVKRKKLGRIDSHNRWHSIEKKWLDLYRNRDVEPGLSARHAVTHQDEWLCEAYMETDYTALKQEDFEQTIRDYLAFLVARGGITHETVRSFHDTKRKLSRAARASNDNPTRRHCIRVTHLSWKWSLRACRED